MYLITLPIACIETSISVAQNFLMHPFIFLQNWQYVLYIKTVMAENMTFIL